MGPGTSVADPPAAREGGRRARLFWVYLAGVAVDVWLLFVVLDVQMGRGLAEDISSGTGRFVASALVFVPLAAVGLLPALVLTHELAARQPPPPPIGRAIAGAVAWGAWAAVVVLSGSSLSGLVLFPASVFAAVGMLAVSGALVATLGLDHETRAPGRNLIGLALAIALLVMVGSLS